MLALESVRSVQPIAVSPFSALTYEKRLKILKWHWYANVHLDIVQVILWLLTCYMKIPISTKQLLPNTPRDYTQSTQQGLIAMCIRVIHIFKCSHQRKEISNCAASRGGTCTTIRPMQLSHSQNCSDCGGHGK